MLLPEIWEGGFVQFIWLHNSELFQKIYYFVIAKLIGDFMVGKINKKMPIVEILQKVPQAAGVMMEHGLHCVGCAAASYENLEQGAQAHGMSDEDIDKMVQEINKVAKDDESGEDGGGEDDCDSDSDEE